MRQFVIFCYLIFYFGLGWAQNVSDWTLHFPYRKATNLVASDSHIYCLTESGIFSYSLIDNEVDVYNKTNGLSDTDLSAMAWSTENQILILAYRNGNIDLWTETGVVNLPELKDYAAISDKRINSIFIADKSAYLATNFGIVALNLEKKEIAETYLIGNNGSQIQVNDVLLNGGLIWAATESGLYYASLDSNNLADFNNWTLRTDLPNYQFAFTDLVVWNGAMYALQHPTSSASTIFKVDENTWSEFQAFSDFIYSIKEFNDRLYVVFNESVSIYEDNGATNAKIENKSASHIRDVGIANNRIFLADYENSLLEWTNGTVTSLKPDGPAQKEITSIYSVGKQTWTSAGGYSSIYENLNMPAELYLYQDKRWQTFGKDDFADFADANDINSITANQFDENLLYAGTWGDGLFVLKQNEAIQHYKSTNSPLESKGISAMCTDNQGNLWLLDAASTAPVKVLTYEGNWVALAYNNIANKVDFKKIIALGNGDKWVLNSPGSLLFAFNENSSLENGDDDVSASFRLRDENSSVINSNVYDICEDRNSNVWVATSGGVAVYADPGAVFRDGDFYAYRPIISIDGATQYLLSTERVNCIAVNGANQKWFGTANTGAYLISDDGESQLSHFSMDNSPLPSNNILKISVNPDTGEVFFVTDNGMVSYRGKVTEGTSDFSNLYVYPNPVRETYHGSVTVSGLMSNSIVKISDVSGNLVWEGESEGGQFVWDGKNFSGNRVHTGVYLIFCSSADASKSKVIKLLFIN